MKPHVLDWNWLKAIPKSHVRLKDGRLDLHPSDPYDGAYLQLRSVTYGDVDGDRRRTAVDLVYGSGGTANWHYLYVFKSVNGTVAPIAILQSGSRAYGGLVAVRIDQGLIVLDFADEDSAALEQGRLSVYPRLGRHNGASADGQANLCISSLTSL